MIVEDYMKIIKVDNFARDHISDTLVAENVSEWWAKSIVELLNDKYSGDHSPDYFRAVPDDHKLYEFEP